MAFSGQFFSTQYLVMLYQSNLGLRLTADHNEAKNGGNGDAIPLSHLAGALEIIQFITFSFLQEKKLEEMEKIYEKYINDQITCIPLLVLHYAVKFQICSATELLKHPKKYKFNQKGIELEARIMVDYYIKHNSFYPLELVVKNLPNLANELCNNFNQKLQLRLQLNYSQYANSSDMDYLILTNIENNLYKDGYDFNNYPLGKCGYHHFKSSQVIKQLMFLAGDNRNEPNEIKLEQRIIKAIKAVLHQPLNQLINEIESKITATYSDEFISACHAMIALVIELTENEELLIEQSTKILENTLNLIHNPSEFRSFFANIKHYEMVAGGKLSAYLMLIAGWIAKIISFNNLGNGWIHLANKQLDLIESVDRIGFLIQKTE